MPLASTSTSAKRAENGISTLQHSALVSKLEVRGGSNFERVQAELVEVVQVKRRLVQKKRKSQIEISISPSVASLSTALWFPTGAVV